MMENMRRKEEDLGELRRALEDKDQQLRHKDVDLQRSTAASRSQSPSTRESKQSAVNALRGEVAAKDSALIVSHYELHKEKHLRDRLEQKNLKLMDRMQKLMMVVETMRKENVMLERNLTKREMAQEDKDRQLRQVTDKHKELQKHLRAKSKFADNDLSL